MWHMASSTTDLPRPFGPFTLLRLLAQGGMGAVYLALRPLTAEDASRRGSVSGAEEVCVIKLVRADLKTDREAVGRFLDEARVVQMLSHPKVVRTIDAGVVDKNYFLALEFISGKNLRDLHAEAQRQGTSIPVEVILHCVTDILDALHYAHTLRNADGGPMGIIHRDVSPHNVMLGFDGKVKLIDFGLAMHELKRELTRPGVMVGKLRYNAPEQVRDRAIDGRADLYSCGVMLYEMFMNERFYEGLAEEQIWRVAMKGDYRPARFRELDDDIRNFLEVALAADPTRRFPDARQMREALLDLAEGRGIDISRMRKSARGFVQQLFPEEGPRERTMMSQANGIAQARTKFVKPDPVSMLSSQANEVSSLLMSQELKTTAGRNHVNASKSREPAQKPAPPRSEDTNITGDERERQKLQNWMEHFAGPDALTSLPQDAIVSQPSFGDDDIGDELPAPTPRPTLGAKGRPPQPRYEAPTKPLSAGTAPDLDAGLMQAVQALAPRTPPPVHARAAEDDLPARPSAMPAVPASTKSSMRRKPTPQPPKPIHTRDSSPPVVAHKPNVWWPIASAVLLLLLIAAVILMVMRNRDDAAKAPPSDDATNATLTLTPSVAPVVPVIPVITPTPVLSTVGTATPTPTPTLPPTTDVVEDVRPTQPVTGPTPDPKRNQNQNKPDRDKKPDKPDKPVEAPPNNKKGPPKTTPRSFGEQVDYLRKHCMKRVACAASVVDAMNNLKDMSPAELKEVKEQAPRCIERCQR
jgi:serine/threonine protein kinase